jgi:hypothetical protein
MREAVIQYVKWAIERCSFQEPILDTCAGWGSNDYQPLFSRKRFIKQDVRDFDPPGIDLICNGVSRSQPKKIVRDSVRLSLLAK